jgi:membrane protein implicated in regulation of membrane protease activity
MTVLLVLGAIGLLVVVAGILAGELFDGLLDGLTPGDLGPGVTAALGAALAAFGFGGALVLRTSSLALAAACGLGGIMAVAVGISAYLASRALIGSEAAPARSSDLYGVFGTVVSAIPAVGLGEVALVHGGTRLKLAARADQPLPARTRVYVLEVLSETAVVVAPASPVLPTT